MMSDAQLSDIAQRASLFVDYGDRAAIRPEDVAALLDEVYAARADREHLVMMTRQHLDQITRLEDEAAQAIRAEAKAHDD